MIKKIQVIPYKIVNGNSLYFVAKRNGVNTFQSITGHVGDNIDGEELIEAALRETNEEIGVRYFLNFINPEINFTFTSASGTKYREYIFALEIGEQKTTLEKAEFESFEFLTFAQGLKKLTWNSAKDALKIINEKIVNKEYPKIFTISGAGGSGKETIIDEVLKKIKNAERAKTANTRPVRAREQKPKKGRIFLSKEEFIKLDKSGEMIESNFFNGHWYGTPWKEIENILVEGKDIVIEVDVNGVKAFKRQFTNVISIFLWVELADLKKRLILRGQDSAKTIENRLKIAEDEMKESKIYDYIVANKEGKLEDAVREAIEIINKNRR